MSTPGGIELDESVSLGYMVLEGLLGQSEQTLLSYSLLWLHSDLLKRKQNS